MVVLMKIEEKGRWGEIEKEGRRQKADNKRAGRGSKVMME
jgi:hypothetical protein